MFACGCARVTVAGVGAVFDTVTLTGADVVMLPAASFACAVRFTAPFAVPVVSQLMVKGAVVAVPIVAVPARNVTLVTPTLSVAVAVTGTVPVTVAAAAGAESAT